MTKNSPSARNVFERMHVFCDDLFLFEYFIDYSELLEKYAQIISILQQGCQCFLFF